MRIRVQSLSTLNSQLSTRARAFTLLELLAAITIIAILAGIVIGAGRRASETGKIARARAELAVLGAALEDYRRAYGDYPRTDDEAQLLRALLGQRGPASDAAIAGRALIEAARFNIVAEALRDPWDRPYVYAYKTQNPWTNSSYVLYSAGPDGADAPALLAGGFPDVAPAANLDNIPANR
ncbi:MAG: type II secretion system protein GspG [Opitutae bacterium]|nr:type II secretion system protein GspG [Opitutae bacterium]